MKARKRFLKTLAILMTVCFLVQSVAGATSRSAETQKEIVVLGDVDSQKAQQIINTINGEEIISTRGNILCVFGHSTAKTTAIGTEHRVYATAPRCVRTNYDVTYCTRSGCDYITYTQVGGSTRIYCCS